MMYFEKAIEMYREAHTAADMGNLIAFCNKHGFNFADVEECAMWVDDEE